MIPKPFGYFAPTTLKDALSLLSKYKDDAKILAGGQSLIPLMKLRLASPKYIIDINRIPGLSYVRQVDGKIRLGALTRHYEVETSKLLKAKCEILPETAGWIGDPQVRNAGTIGGSVSHADPAADYPATVLALNATLVAIAPKGKRSIPAAKFFTDTFSTALKTNEILTEVVVPLPPQRSGGSYAKFERKAGDFATVGAALQLTLDSGGACKSVGIGLAAAGPKPIKATRAEKVAIGKVPDKGLMEEVAAKASEESDPISDLRGSSEYKREMVKVFVRRAMEAALARSKGR